jgi:hypothetical protein
MSARKALAAFAVAILIGHHVGTATAPLGDVGVTRWADWIDFLVPIAVLGTAALVLKGARAQSRSWVLLGIGAVVYAEGHGVHLSANSIGNELDYGATGHLWDEVVGHYVWYAGLVLVVVALAMALRDVALRSWVQWPLAVGVGLTWMTNGVEGGTPWFSLVVAAGLIAWGLRLRGDVGRLLVVTYGTALVLLAGFGLWQGGFPEFTELGWI